jgi:hypothetical protein
MSRTWEREESEVAIGVNVGKNSVFLNAKYTANLKT